MVAAKQSRITPTFGRLRQLKKKSLNEKTEKNNPKVKGERNQMSEKIRLGNSGEISYPQPQDGFSVWMESGVWYTAKIVSDDFGGHDYDNGGYDQGVRDCKCGCFMTAFSSGGSVDPFGKCPENKKPKKQYCPTCGKEKETK